MIQPEIQLPQLFTLTQEPTGYIFDKQDPSRLRGYIGLKFLISSERQLVFNTKRHKGRDVPVVGVGGVVIPVVEVIDRLSTVGEETNDEIKRLELLSSHGNKPNVLPTLRFNISDGVLEPVEE